MGKHCKIRGKARHAKPSTKTKATRKLAIAGAGAVAMPAAALTFSGTAHAATGAQWDCIAQFESGQRWHLESGDPEGAPGTGASAWGGGLQFQPASWAGAISELVGHGVDVSHFGNHASSSSKGQQILAAEALEGVQGPSAWATNGMSSCATLSPSMYDGGPNPWGLSGTNVPAAVIAGTDETGGTTPPPVTPPPVTPPPTPAPVHWWKNCTVAHEHGWHDFRKASSGYRPALDGDGDGIACETGGWHTKPVPVPAPLPVPESGDYIVVHGDTVSEVAARFNVPLATVEGMNPGIIAGDRPDDYSLIFAGGHIHLPLNLK